MVLSPSPASSPRGRSADIPGLGWVCGPAGLNSFLLGDGGCGSVWGSRAGQEALWIQMGYGGQGDGNSGVACHPPPFGLAMTQVLVCVLSFLFWVHVFYLVVVVISF